MQKIEAESSLHRNWIPKYKWKYDKCDEEIKNIIEKEQTAR